ncbi:SpoIIE family protein phosphatase [Streptomyces sp. NPDC020681]|uniref:SpoIIE family protein phosphatase n=1 Tax=Streptomyces sp. NPDC020681 TaxID=3365083 RepID=UPI0037AF5949
MASDDPLLVVDTSGVVLEWSRAARALFGLSASEVVGRPVASLTTAAGVPADGIAATPLDRAMAEGLLLRPVSREDGSGAWAVYRAAPDESADAINKALLKALFSLSPIGMQVLDHDLRILRVNSAAGGMSGATYEGLIGRRLREAIQLTAPDATEAMVRDVLATSEPAIDRIVGAHPPSDPDREHLYSVSVLPLHDTDGRVLAAASAVVDVTEREQALARTRILTAVREEVGHTLEMDTTCAELVHVLVPAFADDAEVDLLDPVIRGAEPPSAPVAPDVPLRRMAFASADRSRVSFAAATGPFRFPAAWMQSLNDLRPHLVAHSPDEPSHPGSSPGRAPGTHSAIVAPLTLRGRVLGTMSLYRSPGRAVFEQEDLDLALDLAAWIALHIDNARRYTREHTIALTLHRHLLPQLPLARTGMDTSHFHPPMGASGGWFDVIPLSGARVALTVGRVSGGDIHATTAMGQVRTAIHTLSSLDLECGELMARLNDTVTLLAAERAAPDAGDPLPRKGLTVGCAYGIYDPLTLNCTISTAGHPPPVLAHPDGTTEIPDLPQAPPLGADSDGAVFAATRLDLDEGSVIGLYTDVFLPADDTEAAACRDELRQILADTGRSLDAMRDEAVRTAAPEEPDVDAILLLVRAHTIDTDRVATWDLPLDPAAVATARARTRRLLAEWGLDELAFATELIVSELTTNAVHYGTPPLKLRLIHGHNLTCEVSDSNPAAPHLRHAKASDEGGRGLFICAQLARRWGVRFTNEGKTIWTEQELPPPRN